VSADFLVSRSAVGENIRSVRLFMKETEADTILYEVSGWCKVVPGAFGVETVCKALELVGRISEESLAKCKSYGQKAQQLKTMYKQYIHKERVPTEFASLNLPASAVVPRQATLVADASGAASVAAPDDASLHGDTSPAAPVLKPARYNARLHKASLLAIVRAAPYHGIVPRGGKYVRDVANAMPRADGVLWKTQPIERALDTLKSSDDIQ
jgi:hypothetical protein